MKRAGVAVKSIVIALLLVSMLSFAGCFESSAYDIAVKNGFEGTEAEWLESLKGAPGKDGKNSEITIYDIFDAYKEENPDATFEEFLAQFLSVEYADQEKAAAKAMKSAVSVFSKFAKGSGVNTTAYSSAGAGVIYRLSGKTAYIITNYHVVYDAESNRQDKISGDIDVYLYGGQVEGRELSAVFLGGSISKDIAVLRVISDRLESDAVAAAEVVDSNGIFAGSTALAVGNPEADGISVTAGVISVDSENIGMTALDNSSKSVYHRVIRVDTAINGGNSGGGLFDGRGRLMGIVNAKMVDASIENIGYAIPINVAAGIADKVIAGEGNKCLLGITTKISDSKAVFDADTGRISIEETITVDAITVGGSADGFLQKGDILIGAKLSGQNAISIKRNFYLSDYLYKAAAGDILTLTFLRGTTENAVEIALSNTTPL